MGWELRRHLELEGDVLMVRLGNGQDHACTAGSPSTHSTDPDMQRCRRSRQRCTGDDQSWLRTGSVRLKSGSRASNRRKQQSSHGRALAAGAGGRGLSPGGSGERHGTAAVFSRAAPVRGALSGGCASACESAIARCSSSGWLVRVAVIRTAPHRARFETTWTGTTTCRITFRAPSCWESRVPANGGCCGARRLADRNGRRRSRRRAQDRSRPDSAAGARVHLAELLHFLQRRLDARTVAHARRPCATRSAASSWIERRWPLQAAKCPRVFTTG